MAEEQVTEKIRRLMDLPTEILVVIARYAIEVPSIHKYESNLPLAKWLPVNHMTANIVRRLVFREPILEIRVRSTSSRILNSGFQMFGKTYQISFAKETGSAEKLRPILHRSHDSKRAQDTTYKSTEPLLDVLPRFCRIHVYLSIGPKRGRADRLGSENVRSRLEAHDENLYRCRAILRSLLSCINQEMQEIQVTIALQKYGHDPPRAEQALNAGRFLVDQFRDMRKVKSFKFRELLEEDLTNRHSCKMITRDRVCRFDDLGLGPTLPGDPKGAFLEYNKILAGELARSGRTQRPISYAFAQAVEIGFLMEILRMEQSAGSGSGPIEELLRKCTGSKLSHRALLYLEMGAVEELSQLRDWISDVLEGIHSNRMYELEYRSSLANVFRVSLKDGVDQAYPLSHPMPADQITRQFFSRLRKLTNWISLPVEMDENFGGELDAAGRIVLHRARGHTYSLPKTPDLIDTYGHLPWFNGLKDPNAKQESKDCEVAKQE